METRIAFSHKQKHLLFTRRTSYGSCESDFPLHSHGLIELVLPKVGGIGYEVDGGTVMLPPNTLIVIAPGVRHRILVPPGCAYERYSVLIDLRMLPGSAIVGFGQSYVLLHCDEELSAIYSRAERYVRELPQDTHRTLFSALSLELYYLVLKKSRGRARTSSETVNRALAYIDLHFTEIRQIGEISDALYLSRNYFQTLFRRHTGKTPLAYLTERRLAVARLRIIGGERPTVVAKECGFDDYTSFYRGYRRQYGHAPSDLSALSDGSIETLS